MHRSIGALGLAVTVALPSAQAGTLPSLSVPTFSLQYLSNDGFWGPIDTAVSVRSTGAAATVISLDSTAQNLGTLISTGSTQRSDFDSSVIRFQAAQGYRITGISFSAEVTGTLDPAVLPPEAYNIISYRPTNYAWGSASITPAGASSPQPQQQFAVDTITAATTVGLTVNNTLGLDTFDLDASLGGWAAGAASYYAMPGDEEPYANTRYGAGILHFANPTMTVYTELLPGAVAPVPEPGQWAMLAGGLMLLGVVLRRRA